MRTPILLFLLSTAAVAQLDTNVITVTASRQLSSQPDQASVSVMVIASQAQTIDAVLAALPQGLTVANLVSTSGYGTGQVLWTFSMTVPISSLTSTIAPLQAAATHSSFPIEYYVGSSSLSTQPACPYPALISDARAQAAKLAAAAGVTLGQIVTLAPGTTQTPATAALLGVVLQLLPGAVGTVPGSLSGFLIGFPAVSSQITYPTSSCSLTVQFQIGQ